MKLLNIISIIITALLLPSLALGSQSEFKIAANDGAINDNYDVEFAISSTIAIIGADSNSNNGAGSGSAYLHSLVQSANDLCTNATNLTCGDTVTGSTFFATNLDAPDSCLVKLNNAPGVWYTFTGTGDNITASLCGSDYDTKIGIFANGCSDSTRFCIAGNDDVCGLQSEVVFPTFPGIEYYIYVTGFDTLSGNFQLAFNCTPATCSIAPTSSTDQVGSTNVQISWSMVSGAVYYEILGGPLSSPQSTFTVPATQTQLLVNGLGLGVTYSWRIRAVCNLSGTSKSPYSLTQVFTTLTSCNPPDTLFTDPITSNTARLNWSTVIGASSYNIFGNVLGNPNPIKLTINDPNTTTFDVFNLTPNTSYYWTVVSKCGADVSAIGVIDTFTTLAMVNKSDDNHLSSIIDHPPQKLTIYPNPASDHVRIQINAFDPADQVMIHIYNQEGQRVLKAFEATVNGMVYLQLPDHLVNGIYQVQVGWNNRRHSEKLVLIK